MRHKAWSPHMNSVTVISCTSEKYRLLLMTKANNLTPHLSWCKGRKLWAMASNIRHESMVCSTCLKPAASSSLGGLMFEHHGRHHTNGPYYGAECAAQLRQHAMWHWSGPCFWSSCRWKVQHAWFELRFCYSKTIRKLEIISNSSWIILNMHYSRANI